jgi:hypothetical protein
MHTLSRKVLDAAKRFGVKPIRSSWRSEGGACALVLFCAGKFGSLPPSEESAEIDAKAFFKNGPFRVGFLFGFDGEPAPDLPAHRHKAHFRGYMLGCLVAKEVLS